MIETQAVSVNFGQGIDTKTDSKLVIQGKLTLLENGVFTSAKRISKRNGYDAITNAVYGGGTLSTPYLTKSFQNELIAADGKNFYSYSQALSKWVSKGHYESIAVSNSEISGTTVFGTGGAGYSSQSSQSSAISQNYVAYSWSQKDSNGNYAVLAIVRDATTGTPIYPETAVVSSLTGLPCPKIVALSNSIFGIFYIDGSLNLVVKVLTIGPSSVSVSSAANIATDFSRFNFDVTPLASGCVLVYNATVTGTQNASVKSLLIDSNGNVTRTVSHAITRSATVQFSVAACVDPSNNQIWSIFSTGSSSSSMSFTYYCYDSTLTTLVASGSFGSTISTITRMGAAANSGSCYLFYNYANPVSAGFSNIAAYQLTNAGTANLYTFGTQGIDLLTKPFFVNGALYVGGVFYSAIPTQNTAFLFEASSQTVVAKFLVHNAWSEALPGTPGVVTFPVNALSASKVLVALPFDIARESIGAIGSSTPLLGTTAITLDFNHQDANQATRVGRSLILNGASPKLYDGNTLTSFGFDIYPVLTASQTTGGSMALGTYTYYAVFQWVDANGDVHQSTPSDPITITLTGSNNAAAITVTNYPFSDKSAVQIIVYRTPANAVGAYAVNAFQSSPSAFSTSWTDTISDPITGNQALYTNGGVIENSACPPSMIMAVHNNRLWMMDSEQSNVAWYSKTLGPGAGISMSDLFTYQADTYGGEITGCASMDDKLILFKKTLPVFVFGDGANDSGSGSTLGPSQRVPSDTGCNSSKSVVVMPNGVMFKGDKGIYLLDRSLNMGYIGADAEAFNLETITSALLMSSVNQIRFLTSSGSALVYDYIMQQWSTFTNHAGYSADLWNGVYTYAKTDGRIYTENSASYLDGASAYTLRAKTSWLKFAGVQGFQRVRRVGFLGDILGTASHGVQISAAYDFGTTFSTPIQYLPTVAGAVQCRERLPQQKCDALQLLIEEVTSGASGEYIDFSDLSFEVGIKRGINKMSASQSVG